MPMMPSPLGILPFAAVKLIGYTFAGDYLNRRYTTEGELGDATPAVLPVVFGLSRAVLGILSGVAVGVLGATADLSTPAILAFLAPIRSLEWMLLIWWFYERRRPQQTTVKYALQGTALSYLLDVPAWAAWFVTPGRFFWC